MWWFVLGYVVIGVVAIRVIAELPMWRDWSDDRTPTSILGGVFWPLAIAVGLILLLYTFALEPLATPRRIHRQRRQERMTEVAKTRAREAEKAARTYGLAYPTLDEDGRRSSPWYLP